MIGTFLFTSNDENTAVAVNVVEPTSAVPNNKLVDTRPKLSVTPDPPTKNPMPEFRQLIVTPGTGVPATVLRVAIADRVFPGAVEDGASIVKLKFEMFGEKNNPDREVVVEMMLLVRIDAVISRTADPFEFVGFTTMRAMPEALVMEVALAI